MEKGAVLIFLCISAISLTCAYPRAEVDVITKPKPGDEFVYVQTSGSGARPIARKDKHLFETSHKLPASLTYILNDEADEIIPTKPSKQKRSADPERLAPAPAGAIKLDVNALLAKYKDVIKTTTATPSKSTTTSKPSRRTTPNRRTKKEAKEEASVEVTSASPSLTTAASTPKKLDELDVPLLASGSEKQRSRIQIKKAPNGQEYEYEYVYYYYDDDDDAKAKVSNAHDGPAKETEKTPEANEVLPASSKSRTRGRQLGEEEVGEERLPAQTRFPPRSRNLNTTPLPEEETKPTRGRARGRPTTPAAPVADTDNVSDETQGTRGRTRANVRRPSLELVDNASFNTHTNTAGAEPSVAAPSFPADLPAGPEPIKSVVEEVEEKVTIQPEAEGTTIMSPMDKVALDLYAILQGTQKLSGEDSEPSSSNESATNASDEVEATTLEPVTEIVTTPSTTTTTTTTPAPTTTTTTEAAPVGRNRFKGRGNRKTTAASSSTEATPAEPKPKNKYGRPSFGAARPRPGARTTAAPVEDEAVKEEAKPVSHTRPTLSRGRFGASRNRARTTAAPSEAAEEASTAAPAAAPRASVTRSRPFNLRTRGRSTTAAPQEDVSDESSHESSTTVRTRRIQTNSAVRPLRPGPRINLTRGRPSTTTTTEEPAEDHVTGDDLASSAASEATEDKEAETSTAPVDNSPLGRLKSKHRVNVQARPKAAASAPVQVRRSNPLIGRRRPGQSAETSSEAPQEASTEAVVAESEEASENDEESAVSSSTTTEGPKGLNKLLAGRRRLVHRPSASPNN